LYDKFEFKSRPRPSKVLKESPDDDNDDVYLNKLQTKGVKKHILYM
jgi:hypothetical protein